MILVKNLKFLYCSFLSKIDWEIVCGNVVIENKPFQTTAIWILQVHQIGFFLRGQLMILVSVAAFELFTFFCADLIQSEGSWKLFSTSDWLISA